MAQPNAEMIVISDEEEDDEEVAEGVAPAGQPMRDRVERIALFDFLRLVAGNREMPVGHRTNEALIASLKAKETITSDSLARAMLACPRELFVPAPHRAEALMDRPIRVESAGFNISAPHVQAASLQALNIESGQRVLDVGCGCGIVTAYAAYLAGSSGEVVGIDIRDKAIRLATDNLQRLRAQNIEFSEVAAPITLEQHNVFIPLQRHRGRYDAVHVGGAMPENRLRELLELLAPGGGRIVAPLANDLRLVTKFPDGSIRQRVLSQVSFSELELPRDVEVVQALQQERADAARRVEVPPSSFVADLAHLAAPGADLSEVAAAAAAVTAEAAGVPAAPPSAAPPAPASPRRNGSGVRPRSNTSLADAHLAPATLPPAHRSAAAAAASAAGRGSGDGGASGGRSGRSSASGSSGSGRAASTSTVSVRSTADEDLEAGPQPPPPSYRTASATAAPHFGPPFGIAAGGWERVAEVAAGWRRQLAHCEVPTAMDTSAPTEAGREGRPGTAAATAAAPDGEAERGLEGGKHVTAAATAAAPAGPQEAEPPSPPAPSTQPPGFLEPQTADAAASAADTAGDGSGRSYLSYRVYGGPVLALGPPDCELEGPGWRLPAHKAVLQARCELLRAHMSSGMRDSDSDHYQVPEAVERAEAMEAFLHYVYQDCLPPGGVEPEVVPQLLHAGIYYGCHRLVRLCESLLARELVRAGTCSASSRSRSSSRSADGTAAAAATSAGGGAGTSWGPGWGGGVSKGAGMAAGCKDGGEQPGQGGEAGRGEEDPEVLAAAVEAAGPLLAMADEGGLDQLRSVAMQFILDHFPAVAATEGYRQLPRPLVDAVAAEAVQRYDDLLRQLSRLAAQPQGPEELDD